MGTRKIVGSDVIQTRIDNRENNNLWYYVGAINSELETGIIQEDGSIDLVFYFQIEQGMIDQIVETYENEGWIVDVGVTSATLKKLKSVSGRTDFNFLPS